MAEIKDKNIIHSSGSDENWLKQKMRSLGDGTFAASVFVESSQDSREVVTKEIQGASIGNLSLAINNYLATSQNSLIDIKVFGLGILFFAMIIEKVKN
jgi:hypothetical protein